MLGLNVQPPARKLGDKLILKRLIFKSSNSLYVFCKDKVIKTNYDL